MATVIQFPEPKSDCPDVASECIRALMRDGFPRYWDENPTLTYWQAVYGFAAFLEDEFHKSDA